MAYELLIGVNVVDEDQYNAYRKHMTPILESYGGGYRYDFRISEVLKSETDVSFNRAIVLYFPDERSYQSFFADEAYKAVYATYFSNAVGNSTIISRYENKG